MLTRYLRRPNQLVLSVISRGGIDGSLEPSALGTLPTGTFVVPMFSGTVLPTMSRSRRQYDAIKNLLLLSVFCAALALPVLDPALHLIIRAGERGYAWQPPADNVHCCHALFFWYCIRVLIGVRRMVPGGRSATFTPLVRLQQLGAAQRTW